MFLLIDFFAGSLILNFIKWVRKGWWLDVGIMLSAWTLPWSTLRWVLKLFLLLHDHALILQIRSDLRHCKHLVAVFEVMQHRYVMVWYQTLCCWIVVQGLFILLREWAKIFKVDLVQVCGEDQLQTIFCFDQLKVHYQLIMIWIRRVNLVDWWLFDLCMMRSLFELFFILCSFIELICHVVLFWRVVHIAFSFLTSTSSSSTLGTAEICVA